MGSELVRNASVTYEETINWHLCIDATPKKKGKVFGCIFFGISKSEIGSGRGRHLQWRGMD